jgi:tetratricopeptide (TPR) repeat protein
MAMKAEHRKESPTHAVTEHVGRFLKDVKNRPSNTSIIFCLVLVLVVALVIGWMNYRKWEQKSDAARWFKFGSATTLEELEAVDKDNQGTIPALMARFEEARVLLRKGLEKYASSDEKERTDAQANIKKAAELYEKLAKQVDEFRGLSSADSAGPLLQQEALRGAAKAYESQGDLDQALTYYKRLKDSKPESELTHHAAERVQKLEDPESRKDLDNFYAELKKSLTAKAPGTTP